MYINLFLLIHQDILNMLWKSTIIDVKNGSLEQLNKKLLRLVIAFILTLLKCLIIYSYPVTETMSSHIASKYNLSVVITRTGRMTFLRKLSYNLASISWKIPFFSHGMNHGCVNSGKVNVLCVPSGEYL